jgi:hypothetical protein
MAVHREEITMAIPINWANIKPSLNVQARDADLANWKNESIVVLSGYLGGPEENSTDTRWRLCRKLALDEYILFDKADVLHIANEVINGVQVDPQLESTPVQIWLKSSVPVQRILPQFLAGEIASLYMPQADILRSLNALTSNGFTMPTEGGGGTNIAICVHKPSP